MECITGVTQPKRQNSILVTIPNTWQKSWADEMSIQMRKTKLCQYIFKVFLIGANSEYSWVEMYKPKHSVHSPYMPLFDLDVELSKYRDWID